MAGICDATSSLRALVVGRTGVDALEGSYARALRELGLDVTTWDIGQALGRNIRLGGVGKLISSILGYDFGAHIAFVLSVEQWINRANRELIVAALELRPDVIFVGGVAPVRAGALGQIRAALPDCKFVLIWPDPLLQTLPHVIDSLPAYDIVASYSRSSTDFFRLMGAPRVEWVPLAFDPSLHRPELGLSESDRQKYSCDVSFIGNYRPEREVLVVSLVENGINVKVWGGAEWKRRARNQKFLPRYWAGRPVWGEEFCKVVKASRLCLNIIDATDSAAANMRFFEIPGCGGVQVCTSCSELRMEFPDRVACLYYADVAEAVAIVRQALADQELRARVAQNGQSRVLSSHTYVHRAKMILDLLATSGNEPYEIVQT